MSKSKTKNQKKITPNIKPLFMWAGGKNKLISKYLPHLPKNIKTYSEPFFGAGAMYLWVQENLKPENVTSMILTRALSESIDLFNKIPIFLSSI